MKPDALAGFDSLHGVQRVRLLGTPHVRMWRTSPRSWSAVDAELQRVFRNLCLGKIRWPLLIWGDTGRGKTAAILAMCDITVDAAFRTMDGFIESLLGVGTAGSWWETIQERELLVVDELLGRDEVRSVEVDAIKKVLDIREQYRQRVGVYVTNHPPGRLRARDMYGERMYSRLTCGTVFELTGSDRRKT